VVEEEIEELPMNSEIKNILLEREIFDMRIKIYERVGNDFSRAHGL